MTAIPLSWQLRICIASDRSWHIAVVACCDAVCATRHEEDRRSFQCRNFGRDGGRPSEAALQGEASNHPELLRSRAVVVSVREKAPKEASGMEQRDERKRTTAEASKAAMGDIETGSSCGVRDESSGCLLTGWVVSGV